MSDILFIKTSSLGDVIHNMPAVSEVRARLPQARIAWLVEEAYAPLARLHPAVTEVIPVAARRWRRSIASPVTWREIAGWRQGLASRRYDNVIDTQGLLRTGLMTWVTSGRHHGYDRSSIREPLACMFYDVKHRVSRDLHAIERNRILAGLALDYAPKGPPDYGLDRSALRSGGGDRYAMLLHATARPEKEWAPENWIALGRRLERGGIAMVLPWGNEREHARAKHLAAGIPNARVAERMPLDAMARVIAGAQFVIGVDTGLVHLAAALTVPLVAVFVSSRPDLTQPIGQGPIEVVGSRGAPPDVEDVETSLNRLMR